MHPIRDQEQCHVLDLTNPNQHNRSSKPPPQGSLLCLGPEKGRS